MADRNWWMFKAPLLLKERMDFVARERVKQGKDNKTRSYRRLGLAIARENNVWNTITTADLKDDKKGQIGFSSFNIFTIIIVSFLAVVLFAGLIWVMGLLNTTMHDVGLQNEVNAGQAGYVNMTKAADDTFGQANSSIQSLRLVALTLIFSLFLGFMLMNALVRVHPAFFMIYILIVLLAVFLSAPISNSYETLLHSDIYDGTLQTFNSVNWILLNLPIITAIVGILGGIFMFINIMRTGTEEILR